MQTTLQDVLMNILTIAQYPSNKEAFIKRFESYNRLEAILNVFSTLPEDTQAFIKAHSDDPTAIREYIPQDMYKDELQRVTYTELMKLIQSIAPTLTLHQKEKINTLLVTL